jgi:lipopolysaccharide/colanic/teichoic acid biosynthesis glycosyltransferase
MSRARRHRIDSRRTVDVLVATIAIVLLSPVLGASALAVRLTMGKPVLFRQRRSGLHGEEFTIYKLRTMRAERHLGEPDDARLTSMGRFLRKTSIDELPQLANILRGDMSLIGPRPTLPEQVARYGPRERRRLEVRPGLTGWAQVSGRNSLSWPQRIELDIWYIDHRSLWLDLRILARTVRGLVRPSGIVGEGGINPGFPGDGLTVPPGDDPAEHR